MSAPALDSTEAAARLDDWFRSVLAAVDESLFHVAREKRHRGAAVLSVLTRNARILTAGSVDRGGALYSPLCFTLAAACRMLRLEPRRRHWAAAVANVLGTLSREVSWSRRGKDPKFVGIRVGSAPEVFKGLMDESLVLAGATGEPTILNESNRKTALGLAVNWGMRFLLAYALETAPRRGRRRRDTRDLSWVRSVMAPLTRAA